ncbi:MAG: hypothetical protein JNL92_25125 [Opitutaceae bacterium]|nr:hypothetical protein [Opitutaceae bacterium]
MFFPLDSVLTRRLFFLGGVAGILLAGCSSAPPPKDYTPVVARFFLESASGDGTPLTLPQSGVRVTVNPKPVIAEGDVINVELVQVDLGKCLLFQLSTSAVRDFYRMTVTHQGRRLVMVLDGEAVGARRIDGPITNGVLYVFVERPESELPALVNNLKKSSVAIQRELARKG